MFYVSSFFGSKFVIVGFVKELNLLKFLIKDLIDEFILCGDDSNNIISVLILFSFNDFFPLLNIEIASDFGQEDTKRENDNSPGGVNDVPDSWGLLGNFDDLVCDLIGDSLEDGLCCGEGLITSPEESIKVSEVGLVDSFRNAQLLILILIKDCLSIVLTGLTGGVEN